MVKRIVDNYLDDIKNLLENFLDKYLFIIKDCLCIFHIKLGKYIVLTFLSCKFFKYLY